MTDKADPTRVTVGPSAFASLPYLYAVVMHEYQHVLERQSLAKHQNERNLRAQNAGTASTPKQRGAVAVID